MIIGRNKYVRLFYRKTEAKDGYGLVYSCPVLEMRHSSPKDIAEELIALTVQPNWRWQLRRPAEPGDVFTVNQDSYEFVTPDTKLGSSHPMSLSTWKHLAIARRFSEPAYVG